MRHQLINNLPSASNGSTTPHADTERAQWSFGQRSATGRWVASSCVGKRESCWGARFSARSNCRRASFAALPAAGFTVTGASAAFGAPGRPQSAYLRSHRRATSLVSNMSFGELVVCHASSESAAGEDPPPWAAAPDNATGADAVTKRLVNFSAAPTAATPRLRERFVPGKPTSATATTTAR